MTKKYTLNELLIIAVAREIPTSTTVSDAGSGTAEIAAIGDVGQGRVHRGGASAPFQKSKIVKAL